MTLGRTALLVASGVALAVPAAVVGAAKTAVAARPSVAVTVVLAHRTVEAGTPIKGTVVFRNSSSRAITVNHCVADGWLEVALKSRGYTPQFLHTLVLCPPSVHLRPGVNRFPVTVLTTYGGCVGPGGRPDVSDPACLPGNELPPLPAGRYVTAVQISGLDGLTSGPRPVSVIVRRSSG